MPHTLEVRVYYEDTDLSGVVYHANYLKFFERAREHVLGPQRLARMVDEEGMGFAVYELSMSFKRGARLGDVLEIRSTVERESDYRLVFDQKAYRSADDTLLVAATVDVVCLGTQGQLVELPPSIVGE